MFLRTYIKLWYSKLLGFFFVFTFLLMASANSFSYFFSYYWLTRRVRLRVDMNSLILTYFYLCGGSYGLCSRLPSMAGNSGRQSLVRILLTNFEQIWQNYTFQASWETYQWAAGVRLAVLLRSSNFAISSLASNYSCEGHLICLVWARLPMRFRLRTDTHLKYSYFSCQFIYSLMRRLILMNSSSSGDSRLFSISFMEQMVVSMACIFLQKFISATRQVIFLKVKKSIAPFNYPQRLHSFSFLSAAQVDRIIEFSFTSSSLSTRSLCAQNLRLLGKSVIGISIVPALEYPIARIFFLQWQMVVLRECIQHLIDFLTAKI